MAELFLDLICLWILNLPNTKTGGEEIENYPMEALASRERILFKQTSKFLEESCNVLGGEVDDPLPCNAEKDWAEDRKSFRIRTGTFHNELGEIPVPGRLRRMRL